MKIKYVFFKKAIALIVLCSFFISGTLALADVNEWEYTIRQGDTLSEVAMRELGSWYKYRREILRLNTWIHNENRIPYPSRRPLILPEGNIRRQQREERETREREAREAEERRERERQEQEERRRQEEQRQWEAEQQRIREEQERREREELERLNILLQERTAHCTALDRDIHKLQGVLDSELNTNAQKVNEILTRKEEVNNVSLRKLEETKVQRKAESIKLSDEEKQLKQNLHLINEQLHVCERKSSKLDTQIHKAMDQLENERTEERELDVLDDDLEEIHVLEAELEKQKAKNLEMQAQLEKLNSSIQQQKETMGELAEQEKICMERMLTDFFDVMASEREGTQEELEDEINQLNNRVMESEELHQEARMGA